MSDRKHPMFDDPPVRVSLLNEPIDYTVDFEVKETALERARKRWRMKAEPTDVH